MKSDDTQVIKQKQSANEMMDIFMTDGWTDSHCENVITFHFCVAGYEKGSSTK